ncbi:unnamed protein product [Adineta steineri]|uniref:FAD dependent oxidoreductase central domain-containing protein n=1 Tax=Adineta steineri TaxID=433720 RepID=A0A819CEH0_9BILA|nr:unnamed protein product [Adineta steineri]CAF1400606.1 unnamed protein product [Adineta steineri]CAF3806345.1 unnamed protein product [Adineta steineri]CAF3819393.1 unnamed protein product [Adineta steineri]
MVDPIPLAITFAKLAIAKEDVLTEKQRTGQSNRVTDAVTSNAKSECETLIIGADSFTPDGRLIMNELAEIDNYFVASGSNKHDTNLSTWSVDIRRFIRLHTNKRFLQDRLRELPGKQYSLKYPTYGEVLGYERPLFFKLDEVGKKDFEDLSKQDTFGKARCPTSQSTCTMEWLKIHVPEDNSIFLSDVTALYTALNVIGTKAKHLLSELSGENFNDFARITCQKNFIGKVALLKQKQDGIQKRFVQFLLEDHNHDSDPWICSCTPSSEKITVNYIHGDTYEIDIATKRFKARPNVYQSNEMGCTALLDTNQFCNSILRQISTNSQYVLIL